MTGEKKLCACGCGELLTRRTILNHLKGKGAPHIRAQRVDRLKLVPTMPAQPPEQSSDYEPPHKRVRMMAHPDIQTYPPFSMRKGHASNTASSLSSYQFPEGEMPQEDAKPHHGCPQAVTDIQFPVSHSYAPATHLMDIDTSGPPALSPPSYPFEDINKTAPAPAHIQQRATVEDALDNSDSDEPGLSSDSDSDYDSEESDDEGLSAADWINIDFEREAADFRMSYKYSKYTIQTHFLLNY